MCKLLSCLKDPVHSNLKSLPTLELHFPALAAKIVPNLKRYQNLNLKRDQNQDGRMVSYFEESVLYYGRDPSEVGSTLFAVRSPSASVPSWHLMD